MVDIALRRGAQVIGSSYNEPLITSEWAVEVFRLAREEGLKTVYVSNGNATREVLEYLRPWVDGYKVDLKSMSEKNYHQLGGQLSHVLETIRMVVEMGFWVEVVTLVVPGIQRLGRGAVAGRRLPGLGLARHPLARDRLPQGLQDDRSGQHAAADAAAGGDHRARRPACATSTPATCRAACGVSRAPSAPPAASWWWSGWLIRSCSIAWRRAAAAPSARPSSPASGGETDGARQAAPLRAVQER